MNAQPLTTVIGSYPVKIDSQSIMTSYFKEEQPNWNEYITTAVKAMVTAGVHMISDGQTRDPFTTIFLRQLSGIRIRDRPEITEPIEFSHPITLTDYQMVKNLIPQDRFIVGTLAGPYTLMHSCVDHIYHNEKELAFAFAKVLHKEVMAIQEVVDMISVDEPFFSMGMPAYAPELISTVVKGLNCPTRVHVCGDVSNCVAQLLNLPVDILSHEFKASPQLFDAFQQYSSEKQICLGSVRSDNTAIESVDDIIQHIQKGQDIFGDRIVQIAPDCGQRMLPATVAFEKLTHMVQAWRQLYG